MTEKKSRSCKDCPAALLCWGGEEIHGKDCSHCGQSVVGRMAEGEFQEIGSFLGEDCGQIKWSKHICASCEPDFRRTVGEALYMLLNEHGDQQQEP